MLLNKYFESLQRHRRSEMWEHESELDDDYLDPEITMDIKKVRLLEAEILYKKRLRELQAIEKRSNFSRRLTPDGKIVMNNCKEDETGSVFNMPSKPSCLSKATCMACGNETVYACAFCRAVPYCSATCFNNLRHDELCIQIIEKRRNAALNLTENNSGHTNAMPPLRQPRSLDKPDVRGRHDNSTPKLQPVENFKNYTNNKSFQNKNNSNTVATSNNQKTRNVRFNEPPRRPFSKPNTQPSAVTNNNNHNDEADEDWDSKKVPAAVQKPSEPKPVVPRVQEESKPAPCVVNAKKPDEPVPKVLTAEVVKKDLPLVPANSLVDLLNQGEFAIMTVECATADCASAPGGFVCVMLHEEHKDDYAMMFDELTSACEADDAPFAPSPGESCCVYVTEDSAWYRARYLGEGRSALIDAGRVVKAAKCRKLQERFSKAPEFTCELRETDKCAVGAQLTCVLNKRVGKRVEMSLQDVDSGDEFGEATVCRWTPAVTADVAQVPPAPVLEVCVPRADLRGGMHAIIVDVSDDGVAVMCLEDSTDKLNAVLHGVALYGKTAPLLTSPPKKGDLLVAKFTDNLHYRAMCLRTNVKKNKYLLEYVDYANRDTTSLEMLSPCPEKFDLTNAPALASRVTVCDGEMSLEANCYLNKIKDDGKTVMVNLPDNAKTAPSGSRATLTLVKNNENINYKIKELSTPQWKKKEMKGEDILDSQVILFSDIKSVDLPSSGELRLLDANMLENGRIAVCKVNEPIYDIVKKLPAKMEPYCNSAYGGKPYLPRTGEICIAKSPLDNKWLRAVYIDNADDVSANPNVAVLFLDSGLLHDVPLKDIRKMVPDFVDNIPALSCDIYIEGLPNKSSPETVARVKKFLNIGEDLSSGTVNIINCRKMDSGCWAGEIPGLVKALGSDLD